MSRKKRERNTKMVIILNVVIICVVLFALNMMINKDKQIAPLDYQTEQKSPVL